MPEPLGDSHARYRFDFVGGEADPMLTYAMTVLAADKQARLGSGPELTEYAAFGSVEVDPNLPGVVPVRVTGWLDVRAATPERVVELAAAIAKQATDRAQRDGTAVTVTRESP